MNYELNDLVSGAILACCWAIGLFFSRFYRETGDRLFWRFALAFWLLGVERIALFLVDVTEEWRGWVFLLRLAAFLTIIGAVVDKNRLTATPRREPRRRLRRIRDTP